jgi:hypothetical protein
MVSLKTIDNVGKGIPAPLVTDCCTAFIGVVVGVGVGAEAIKRDELFAACSGFGMAADDIAFPADFFLEAVMKHILE